MSRKIKCSFALIQALVQRFNVANLYIAGFSFGGTITALTASRYPELVRAVICVDLDVQYLDGKTSGIRVKWVATFGGADRHATYRQMLLKTLCQLVWLRDYTLSDIVGTLRSISSTQDHLLPGLANLNLFQTLPRLDVPVFLLQGRHDYVAPIGTAEQYYQRLQAPKGKLLIWFEESAHMPQYEEPGKFREILLTIKHHCEEGSTQQE